ncbi:flagellar type III secretion system pore protein FliP [Xanthobacter sp. VNH20]|uniref:flagellar type III secretion system pore protein FliP n=1 Tax=Xanthobacter sp. VNH20 TaxID=3156616 RepID=UPI0032B5C7A5
MPARALLIAGGAALAGAFLIAATPAAAQTLNLEQLLPDSGGGSTSGRIIQMVALLTVLSVAPGLLIMMTSFTRLAIALSFLRSGLGLQSTPANLVLISLSLFMTFYIMGPTFERAWQDGVRPLTEQKITEQEAIARIADPFRDFMLSQVRSKDLQLFADIAQANAEKPDRKLAAPLPAPPKAANAPDEKIDMRVLIPAFMISELRRGFEIGFLIVLPFLIIDMIVATLVMSMGMMMMPPSVISLPFKVLFFILIDGWNILVSGLVRSFY